MVNLIIITYSFLPFEGKPLLSTFSSFETKVFYFSEIGPKYSIFTV